MKSFFKLSDRGQVEADFSEGTDWEGIECSVNKGHQRPGKRIGVLRIELPSAKVPHFITTFLSDWIITDEVAKLFKKAGITGYTLQPVVVDKVKRENSKDVPLLWELVVTGSGGKAHPDSGIHIIETCDLCGLRQYSSYKNGIIIDESQWDGSDFFTVKGYPKYFLVTERVKDLITTNKLTNVTLIPSHELRWPEGVIRPEDVTRKRKRERF